jgi:hypothetical protein
MWQVVPGLNIGKVNSSVYPWYNVIQILLLLETVQKTDVIDFSTHLIWSMFISNRIVISLQKLKKNKLLCDQMKF